VKSVVKDIDWGSKNAVGNKANLEKIEASVLLKLAYL